MSKRFNQTAILRSLDARCKKCGLGIPDVMLTIHHKNLDTNDVVWGNIVIYCRSCYQAVKKEYKNQRLR